MRLQSQPEKGFRQCVGIDISKAKFTACVCRMNPGEAAVFSDSVEFNNCKTGFNQLVKWARKNTFKDYPILFLMEPTSTYYEALAHHLLKLNFTLYVVQPRRVRAFMESEGVRTKTDAIDAFWLSQMGCIKTNLKAWTAPDPVYLELRQISRTTAEFTKMRTMLSNHKEALINASDPCKEAIKSVEALIRSVENRMAKNERLLHEIVAGHPEVDKMVGYISSIKGIGFSTAVTIIAETQGFSQITSRKQLASFAGLDVVAKDSGTSTPKRHISKHGSMYIRRALYMCSLSASNSNPQMRTVYQRLSSTKPRNVASTAIMRKLLLLAFTLCKSQTTYDPEK